MTSNDIHNNLCACMKELFKLRLIFGTL